MAGGFCGSRVAVRVVDKCLPRTATETVEEPARYSCCIMIDRKWKRTRKGPSVCGWVVDFHCGRGIAILIVTANDVYLAIECRSCDFLPPNRHQGARAPRASLLRSAGTDGCNPQERTQNCYRRTLSHDELIQYLLQNSRGEVPNRGFKGGRSLVAVAYSYVCKRLTRVERPGFLKAAQVQVSKRAPIVRKGLTKDYE